LAGGLAGAFLGADGLRIAPAQPVHTSAGPSKGTLLIIGGGNLEAEIQDAAIQLGRGPDGAPARWVVIPTALADEELPHMKPPEFTARDGVAVTVLHTRDRSEADSADFIAPLQSATAVYFVGGRQWRLVDAYADTRTARALRAVLDRGGLIAGTSAGATIQGSYLVRGAPEGNEIMMSPGHERGFGYLTNAAIDQHVIARGRESDLAQVVAAHPGLLGIGIDEATAVVVQQDRMRVIGRSVVLITDGADHAGRPYYALPAGAQFDLASRQIMPA
jgi:cyanophycinase